MIKHKSPNFSDRTDSNDIDLLVLHYTGMKSADDALARMCDKASEVSAHYMIDEDGTVFSLVPEEKRAWHCGISCWHGKASLNDTSIGIELVNPGHEFGYRPFPDTQMDALITLAKDIIDRHGILPRNVVGHSDIAPTRKEDPGELFDWKGIAWEGIGLWPETKKIRNPHDMLLKPGEEDVGVGRVQKMLADFGYHLRVDGFYGEKTEAVIKAYKRHFVPEVVNIVWDRLAEERLMKLLELVGGESLY